MTEDRTRKVAELLKDERIGMFTTTSPDGTLTSRPMALQEVEFDGDLWFFSAADGHKVGDVATEPRVNVSFAGSGSWLSVNGVASVVTDVATKEELWSPAVGAWFDGGPQDPGVVLLRVEADTAEYWTGPGKVATVLALARKVTGGDPQDVGRNDTVEL